MQKPSDVIRNDIRSVSAHRVFGPMRGIENVSGKTPDGGERPTQTRSKPWLLDTANVIANRSRQIESPII
jgi:hypothetical protein